MHTKRLIQTFAWIAIAILLASSRSAVAQRLEQQQAAGAGTAPPAKSRNSATMRTTGPVSVPYNQLSVEKQLEIAFREIQTLKKQESGLLTQLNDMRASLDANKPLTMKRVDVETLLTSEIIAFTVRLTLASARSISVESAVHPALIARPEFCAIQTPAFAM